MKLRLKQKNIVLLTFPTQKELILTMCRPQEFYEAATSKLRNNKFTYEEVIDFYMDTEGNLDYFNMWTGFNLPGHVMDEFFNRFDLTKREAKLKSAVRKVAKGDYYVIAVKAGDDATLDHELVHAHFYLNADYKKKATSLVNGLPKNILKKITVQLKTMGYTSAVIKDEINAYLSTSKISWLNNDLELNLKKETIKPFIALAKTVL